MNRRTCVCTVLALLLWSEGCVSSEKRAVERDVRARAHEEAVVILRAKLESNLHKGMLPSEVFKVTGDPVSFMLTDAEAVRLGTVFTISEGGLTLVFGTDGKLQAWTLK